MKKIIYAVLLTCVLGFAETSHAQTTLQAGDMAIIGYNRTTSTSFELAIVSLVDIAANTQIYITDWGWSGSSSTFVTNTNTTAEGNISWLTTAPVTKGTVFLITITGGATVTVSGLPGTVSATGWSTTTSTVPVTAGGDNWFIYQGSNATTPTGFVYGFTNYSLTSLGAANGWLTTGQQTSTSVSTSELPSALTNGTTARSLAWLTGSGGSHGDCGVYTGTVSASKSALLTAIGTVSNWTFNDVPTGYYLTSGSAYASGNTLAGNPYFTSFTLPSPASISVGTVASAFSSCAGSVSTAQSFTASGSGLTDNLVLTAPTGFEVSTSSGSGYGSSVSLTPSSGTVSSTTIYVRLSASASGTPSGNVTATSTGATTQNVAVSGTVNALPTITLGSNPSICNGTTSASLTYSATSGSPNQYQIAWGAGAIIAGFSNVGYTTLPASPISITVPSNPGAGTYSGTLTVRNTTTGCTSTNNSMSVTVNALPTITLGSNPSVCNGTTSASLTYSATTSSPNQYQIAWSAGAIIAGFTNVSNTSLPASPISLTVPSNPGAGTYNGTLTVRNTTTGCASTGRSMSVTVNALPTITLGSNPSVCNGTTSASLTYSATTSSPNQYQLSWGAGAIIAGFTNVSYTSLPASPISLTVPSNPGAGTYSGTLTVRNSTTGCASTGRSISVTVNALPTITLGSVTSVATTATSFDLPYTATTGSPNQYSVVTGSPNAMSSFSPVSNSTLSSSPIAVTIPASAAGTYDFVMTVKNSTSGCTSDNKAFTVTVADPVVAPTVTTATASNIQSNAASLGGNVTASGGATVTVRGIVYSSVDATPTIGEQDVVNVEIGSGTGSFAQSITALQLGTTYYYAAYGINSVGTSYGTVQTVVPACDGSSEGSLALDADGSSISIAGSGQYLATGAACRTLALITPSGGSPVSGVVNGKVWVRNTVPTYNGMPFVPRSYEITPVSNAATATATVTLYFSQADFDAYNASYNGADLPYNGTDAEGLRFNARIYKFSGTSSDNSGMPGSYTQPGISITPSTVTWNASMNRWEVSFTTTGFSGFFLGNTTQILPVQILSFKGQTTAVGNVLEWTTAQEENAKEIQLEKSVNGSHFQLLTTIAAKGSGSSYRYQDEQPSGIAYYRLKMVDTDGRFAYSSIVKLTSVAKALQMTLYPNPAKSQLYIHTSASVGVVRLYNSVGALVLQQNWQSGMAIAIDKLPAGNYVVELSSVSATIRERIVKQ